MATDAENTGNTAVGEIAAVDRLVDAMNSHDLEALVGCFAPTYACEFPAHPSRSFTGSERVRHNWEALFAAHPDLTASASSRVRNGSEVWAEWEFRSDSTPPFWQRGVVIVVVTGAVIASSRFYMEPVDA